MAYAQQPNFFVAQPWSYGQTQANIENIKGARNQNALAEQTLEHNAANMEIAQAFRQAIAAGDMDAAMRIDPQAATEFATKQAGLEEAQFKQAQMEAGVIDGILRPFTDELTDEQVMQLAPIALDQLHSQGIAQQVRLSPDTDPARVRDLVGQLRQQINPLLEAPEWTGGQAAMDAQGNPVFMQSDQRGNVRAMPGGFQPPPANEFRTQVDADGNVTTTWGKPVAGPGGEMTTKTQGDLETKVTNSQAGLDRMKRLHADFNEDYFGLEGNLTKYFLGGKAFLNPGSLTPAQREEYENFQGYRQKVAENANTMIREMTGAQMSEHEATRLLEGIPNKDDDAIAFKAKMDSLLTSLTLVNARARYYLQNGWEPPAKGGRWKVGIEDMEGIIQQRADQLAEIYAAGGMDPEEARMQALTETGEEFGL